MGLITWPFRFALRLLRLPFTIMGWITKLACLLVVGIVIAIIVAVVVFLL